MTITHHTLTVTRDLDSEYGPEADVTCLGVTDTCAEWIECGRTLLLGPYGIYVIRYAPGSADAPQPERIP